MSSNMLKRYFVTGLLLWVPDRHHALGPEPDREHHGPEPGAAAPGLESTRLHRPRHSRPWRHPDAADRIRHRRADREPGRRPAGDLGRADPQPDSDRAQHLLERQAGQRHHPVAQRQCVSQGPAGGVSAQGRVDHRLPDRRSHRRPARRSRQERRRTAVQGGAATGRWTWSRSTCRPRRIRRPASS